MDINFTGKYKSITDFSWTDIPDFVVLTGPNGTGKTQLLELIYSTVILKKEIPQRVEITGKTFERNEVTFLRGEWQLENTYDTNLSNIQQERDSIFGSLANPNQIKHDYENQISRYHLYQEILKRSGKTSLSEITKEEFLTLMPDFFVERESSVTHSLSKLFYNYRLTEIDYKDQEISADKLKEDHGEKPWIVLREIITASKLPFSINDPEKIGVRGEFRLKLTHTILNEEVSFQDLSSGEKVLISLIFYLYSSQEKHVFPKLLLLDEPDAHLHPSMTQQFLNVIKDVLVDKYKVQVIMTTHSPSTVILAPEDSLFEMSNVGLKIKKSLSKNHLVSLLTSGLVFVGEGTKYFLVEDKEDVRFYTYFYDQMKKWNLIEADVPLVFIPASTNSKPGGKTVVSDWVTKLRESGLTGILHGLIDNDDGNELSEGLYKLNRYGIENYLADPIVVFATLLDAGHIPHIVGIDISIGEEYKLRTLSPEELQMIADKIFEIVSPEIGKAFSNFDNNIESQLIEVKFSSGLILKYPSWIFTRRGKDIIQTLYNNAFNSSLIRFDTLFKAFQKVSMLPTDLLDKIKEIKNGV